MKNRLISIIIAALIVLSLKLSFGNKRFYSGPSANGRGSFAIHSNQHTKFAFHVNTMSDGSVYGNGELTIAGKSPKIQFDIDRMKVKGNTAVVSGIITDAPGASNFKTGWHCWLKIIDNGNSDTATTDEISILAGSPEFNNDSIAQNPMLYRIERGNIRIN